MGHFLPFETVVAEDIELRGIGAPDAWFEGVGDPETNFTLFAPAGGGGSDGLIARLRPDEDVCAGVAALARPPGAGTEPGRGYVRAADRGAAVSGTVLLTGGASGIGRAVVEAALAEGWRAAVIDLPGESLEAARAAFDPARVRCAGTDVANEAAVAAEVAATEAGFGPLAGVVNSAGIARDLPMLATGTDVFRRILAVNVIGSFVVAREAARAMRGRGGAIVNIASVSGVKGNEGRVAYGASKGAVIAMSRVMAVELAPLRIRVNVIAPGPIETPMVREIHSAGHRERHRRRRPAARRRRRGRRRARHRRHRCRRRCCRPDGAWRRRGRCAWRGIGRGRRLDRLPARREHPDRTRRRASPAASPASAGPPFMRRQARFVVQPPRPRGAIAPARAPHSSPPAGKSRGSTLPAPADDGAPAWARRLRRQQALHQGLATAAHALRGGDASGTGTSVSLREKP